MERCSERVSYDSWGHTHQCENKAVVVRDGKQYCKIHDPEYIKEKEAKHTAKFNKEWADKKARRELESTAIRACKSINPDNPIAVAESIQDMYKALKGILNATICDYCYEDECGGESSCTKGKYGEPCECHNQIHRAEEAGYKALAKAEGK